MGQRYVERTGVKDWRGSVDSAAKKPLRLEGRSLTKENTKVFIKEHDKYCDKVRCGMSDEMLQNPVA